MSEQELHKITGFIMPVGNGAVGKTSLALTLQHDELPPDWVEYLSQVRKTKNLEFQYLIDQQTVSMTRYQVLHQYLIPPGQKDFEVDPLSRSYDQVIEIYHSMIHQIDVVLLSYKITRLETFHDLEYWVEKVSELANLHTNFIMVGTHLDQRKNREVMTESIEAGKRYVIELMRGILPGWKGHCTSIEVSNLNGENISHLRTLISQGLLLSRGMKL
jgi:GTPase SAR1 family protein